MENLSITTAYTISVCILLLSSFVSSFELASVPKKYIDFVFPSITIQNKYIKWKAFNYSFLLLTLLSLVFLFTKELVFFKITFILTTVGLFYLYKLRTIGKDGADQMRLLTFLSFSICFLIESKMGMLLSVSFVGAQALIAYATSGIAKLRSIHWRRGNLLSDILGTYSYGIPKVSGFLKKHSFLEKMASYGAIATMISVPICFFIPNPEYLYISLSCMFLFHFATALLMGLNDFLLTFPLTYPGVLILHGLLHGYVNLYN